MNYRWWLGAGFMFAGMGLLVVDVGLFIQDEDSTITAFIRNYFQVPSNEGVLRSFVAGALTGGLSVHFTGWYQSPKGDA